MSTQINELSTVHDVYDDGETWLKNWSLLRDQGYETLLLDPQPSEISAILIEPKAGSLRRLSWTGTESAPPPSPSQGGMGDVWVAEREAAERYPHFQWPHRETPQVRGKGVFVYPLGPVRADVTECLGYRLTIMGDEILHVQLLSHFKPRHIRTLVAGKGIAQALPIISRFTTTSTVHHSLAMVLAIEELWNIARNEATDITRTLLAELERVASHLGDLATLAASTGLTVPQMEYLHLKEAILRINYQLVGHRYLRGAIVPGGFHRFSPDIEPLQLAREVSLWSDQAEAIGNDLERTSSFLDRLHGAGVIPPEVVAFYRPVGPVGRSAGRPGDLRGVDRYGHYTEFSFTRPVTQSADAYARFRIRLSELADSFRIIRRILGRWEPGAVPEPPNPPPWQTAKPDKTWSTGVVEAPRGLLVYDLHVDPATGRIQRLNVATPSQRNWPVVPDAFANGNILQDFPIIDASFSLSVAGLDG